MCGFAGLVGSRLALRIGGDGQWRGMRLLNKVYSGLVGDQQSTATSGACGFADTSSPSPRSKVDCAERSENVPT